MTMIKADPEMVQAGSLKVTTIQVATPGNGKAAAAVTMCPIVIPATGKAGQAATAMVGALVRSVGLAS